jgi:hypothetical protein
MADLFPALAQTRVLKLTRLRRERVLPVRGAVAVQTGSRVGALDIIAQSSEMAHLFPVPLARYLRTNEAVLSQYLLKQVGEDVQARDIIASKPEAFGSLRRIYRAPGAGHIATLQGAWLGIELLDAPFELRALYRGTIVNVMPRLGVVIEATGALIQGVWGAGGEGFGVLRKTVDTANEILTEDKIDVNARNSVLLAGSEVTESALRRAAQEHAAGLIVGGLPPRLRDLVEELGLPTLVTDGFGPHTIAAPIFDLLVSHVGDETVVNAPGVLNKTLRPEVFIPILVTGGGGETVLPPPTLVGAIGAPVRILGWTHESALGTIAEVLPTPRILENGVSAWGADVDLTTGGRTFVPWENMELIG